ncbi:MAG: hypothetical protein AAGG07_03390 [Planctomycetota bacterium]
MRNLPACLITLCCMALAGCAQPARSPDLARIYDRAAQSAGPERTPVIVLPGILGSKLEDAVDGQRVWGAFTFGAADADTADGARKIALPMEEGKPLAEIRDSVIPTDVLDVVVADVAVFRNLEIGAYVDILQTLAAGQYRDENLGESGAVNYGGLHYTCFQHAYDWRRDVAEAAADLALMVDGAQWLARDVRGLPEDAPVKVDVVAHSMGGLVLRYYLRYGAQPMPEDGSLPDLTWEGAANVRRAVLVGTPSAGSILSLQQLVDGWDLNPLFPNYRSSILGTMPAIYQLLPRARHGFVRDAATNEPIDVFDIATWEKYEWGLADPDQDRILEWLLPDAETAEERREIALDHLRKCLARAEQFHRALDVPASPPPGTELSLFAGDAEPTPTTALVDADGKIRIVGEAPGDNTVTRQSALMDERTDDNWTPGLVSPVAWDRVQFVFEDHLGLTRTPAFSDNLLYLLLEAPDPEGSE